MQGKKPSGIDAAITLHNNSPHDDFSGLTPTEVHHLLYDPFGERSPLQYRKDIDNGVLDRISFFRVVEEFLKIVEREKGIKLTPRGALTRKVLAELYGHKFIYDELLEKGIEKLNLEENCISIVAVKHVSIMAGLVRKSSGKLIITKKGADLLIPVNRIRFFKTIFSVYTEDFNWGFHDLYPEEPIGQLGFGYTIYLLDQFGETERTSEFYAEKYLRAFPDFIRFFSGEGSENGMKRFKHCYNIRTFARFLEWFGFVTIERERDFIKSDGDKIKATGLIKDVFVFS